MIRYKVAAGVTIAGLAGGWFALSVVPAWAALFIPALSSLASLYLLDRIAARKAAALSQAASQTISNGQSGQQPQLAASARTESPAPAESAQPVQAANEAARSQEESIHSHTQDPFWGPIIEYINVIEEVIISEGQKNALDDEIVEKSISLLTRVERLIPQLQSLNDANINHNIQRLVFKDLNGAINPFLNLSGEAKRQNRRLLLNGLKDIQSKLSFYVERIEHRDLIELQTRMDLIHKRYHTTN